MKTFFLVFLVLMMAGLGLSAEPVNPSGAGEVQQLFLPQNEVRVSETPLYVRERMQRAVIRAGKVSQTPLYTEDIEFWDESVQLICLWGTQYLSGQLTEQDFQKLVVGRMHGCTK
ncbi:hypothetical protein Holit_01611 [Hollandina sp. SP2]